MSSVQPPDLSSAGGKPPASTPSLFRKAKDFLKTNPLTQIGISSFASLHLFVLNVCAKYPRLATVYYCVHPAFTREARGVLYGKIQHLHRSRQTDPKEQFAFRRFIHRLEKGLIMRPCRSIFALDYIEETTQLYARLFRYPTTLPNPLQAWGGDVLYRYFQVSDSFHPVIARAKAVFEATGLDMPHPTGAFSPYLRDLSTSPPSRLMISCSLRSADVVSGGMSNALFREKSSTKQWK